MKNSKSIELMENNQVYLAPDTRILLASNSIIFLNGISVPDRIFCSHTDFGEKAFVNFPLPILLMIDVNQNTTLKLNTARTQIIRDSDWREFEKRIIETICIGLSRNRKEKWNDLKKIIYRLVISPEIKEIVKNISV